MTKPGKIILVDRYTREQIQADRETVYVFGDNLSRTGYGGQASAARDEPNAFGIATKWNPGQFLSDDDFAMMLHAELLPRFSLLSTHLLSGGDIVWPKNGIGTGLSALMEHAPSIWMRLEQMRLWLFSLAKEIENADDRSV